MVLEKPFLKIATPKRTYLPSLRSKWGRNLWYWLLQVRNGQK